jgi:hypothetical protein
MEDARFHCAKVQLVQLHAMRCIREVEAYLQAFLLLAKTEANGQIHATAALPQK